MLRTVKRRTALSCGSGEGKSQLGYDLLRSRTGDCCLHDKRA